MSRSIRKANIVIIISARADYGGGPEHIRILLEGLRKDIKIFIACPNDRPYFEIYSRYAKCIEIPHRKFSFISLCKLYLIVKREKIDIIHSHGKGAGTYSRLLHVITGRPVVHTFHGFHYKHLKKIKRLFYLKYELLYSYFTRIFINVSQSEKTECIKAKIFNSSKSVVIPNGIQIPTKLRPISVVAPIEIVNISRLSKEKNIVSLIQIICILKNIAPSFRVQIIGDGPQRRELEEKAYKCGVTSLISFLGFRDDVNSVLERSHIYLTASLGEGLPLSVMEGMANYLPVIASRVPGHTDLVKHEKNGFLFELNKLEDAARYIHQLSTNPSLYQQMAINAHETIKNKYSADYMCACMAEIYGSLAQNG